MKKVDDNLNRSPDRSAESSTASKKPKIKEGEYIDFEESSD